MGCDIHIYSESRINGEWKIQERIEDVNKNYSEFDTPHYDIVDEDTLFLGRNYFLFGILAGVRSWDEPDFEVRGFPENASEGVRLLYNQWESNAHTPSYIYLSELRDWLETEQYEGRKEAVEANIKHWIEELKRVNIGNVIASMNGFLNGKFLDEDYEYITEVIQGWVNKLSKRDGEDQRIVFWFDS